MMIGTCGGNGQRKRTCKALHFNLDSTKKDKPKRRKEVLKQDMTAN